MPCMFLEMASGFTRHMKSRVYYKCSILLPALSSLFLPFLFCLGLSINKIHPPPITTSSLYLDVRSISSNTVLNVLFIIQHFREDEI